MTTNANDGKPPVDAAAVAAQARAEERARQAAIRGCEEAQGREKLADHLASTDISVDQAKAILAAAPKEAAAPGTNAGALDRAMGDTPNVGSGAENGKPNADAKDGDDNVARIIAAGRSTGMKFSEPGKTRH